MQKNLILGYAAGYTVRQLLPFIRTARRNVKSAEIWLICPEEEYANLVALRKNYNVLILTHKKYYPYSIEIFNEPKVCSVSNQNYRPNSLRFLLYFAIWKEVSKRFDKVALCDTRDVLFQHDPFLIKEWPSSALFFLEDSTHRLGTNYYNKLWIKNGYGEDVLNSIGHHAISCCGTILGTPVGLSEYLKKMNSEIGRINPDFDVLEQGIHNYLLRCDPSLKFSLLPDDSAFVSTISSFKPSHAIRFSKGSVLGLCNSPVAIVHQYDRNLYLSFLHNRRIFLSLLKSRIKNMIS